MEKGQGERRRAVGVDRFRLINSPPLSTKKLNLLAPKVVPCASRRDAGLGPRVASRLPRAEKPALRAYVFGVTSRSKSFGDVRSGHDVDPPRE